MNAPCLQAHVSYVKWRSQVFRRLVGEVGDGAAPRLPFLHPTFRNTRQFHASTTYSRSKGKDIRRNVRHKIKRAEEDNAASAGQNVPATSNSAWSLYTEEHLEDLRELVGDLQVLAKEAKDRDITDENDVPFEHGSLLYQKKKTNQPESPLELRPPRKHPAKLRVEEGEIDKTLRENLWAQILASPIRLDRGTKSRLPRDLMNSWGMMLNPKDEQHYFLPIELSDLEALKQELQSSMPGAITGPDAGGTPPISGRRVQITCNRLLVQAMSDEFTTLKPARGSREPIRKIDSRKLSTNLIPYTWRLKYNETEAFAKTQSRFNEVLRREPDDNEPNMKSLARLKNLQWQADIADRMEKMMQERVLVVLDAVGKDNTSGRALEERRVFALPLPENGQFQLSARGGLVENSAGVDEALTPDWLHGAIFLFVGSPASYRQTVEHWHQHALSRQHSGESQLEPLPANDLVPPMVTVGDEYRLPLFSLESLFGPAHADKVTATICQHHMMDLKFWQARTQGSGVNEGESSLQTDAVPDSLVTAGEQVLGAIVRPGSGAAAASAPSPSPTSETDSTLSESNAEPEPYLILIKPRAQHAKPLAREIWQLWRFVGGRSGLDFS